MALKVDTIQNPSSTVINLTLDTSGNVTVGNNLTTTGATSIANLTYTGTLTGSTGILNIGSGQLYKDASGNVGIGTTSPGALLHVSNASAAIRIGLTASSQYTDIYRDGATGFTIYNAAQATPYRSHVWQLGGTEAMRIDTSGNVGIGTTSPASIGGVLSVVANGAGGSGYFRNLATTGITSDQLQVAVAQSTSLSNFYLARFYTNVSVSPTVAFYVQGDGSGYFAGNVGIGTSTPISVAGSTSVSINNATNGGRLDLLKAGVQFGVIYSAAANLFDIEATGASTAMRFNTNGAERMRIDNSGNLQIGTSTNLGKMTTVWNNSTQQGMVLYASTTTFNGSPVLFYNSSGGICGSIGQTASTVAYNTTSDYRLKDNVQPLKNGLETVKALNPVNYNWKIDDANGEGFIAHELQKVIPLAVTGEKDAVNEDGSIKPQSVDYSKVVVHLVAAIQELSAKVAALEAKK